MKTKNVGRGHHVPNYEWQYNKNSFPLLPYLGVKHIKQYAHSCIWSL